METCEGKEEALGITPWTTPGVATLLSILQQSPLAKLSPSPASFLSYPTKCSARLHKYRV